MSDDPRWLPGSVLRVRSVGAGEDPMESRGRFEGFVPLSQSHVLALELDESHEEAGTRRFIPVEKILAIDVLEEGEEPDDDGDQLYYS